MPRYMLDTNTSLLFHEALGRFRLATAQENSCERCLYFGDHEGGAFIRS
jgi:hypothetical protein